LGTYCECSELPSQRPEMIGCEMKAVPVAHNMTRELFVIQLDGHAKSAYRRLAEALKAALRLKDDFPDHNVKVRAMRASNLLHK